MTRCGSEMSKLPSELYRPICELSSYNDLSVLAIVSRAFQGEAERLIWWKLQIGGFIPGVIARSERFLSTPRLHHYVRRLDLYIMQYTPLRNPAGRGYVTSGKIDQSYRPNHRYQPPLLR
jgi:hypothetical protein